MKALVTGGAGFIGSHLVEALVARGDKVTVVDDLSTGRLENLAAVLDDITVYARRWQTVLSAMMRDCGCVYHLAARANVAESMKHPAVEFANNLDLTESVLDKARMMGVPRVVCASSAAAAYNANPYGASKLCGEVLCEMYQKAFDLETIALRFANVYGPRQRCDVSNPPVVAEFVAAACQGEPIVVHGDGSQCRDFVYVKDVVDVLIAAGTQALPAERVIDVGSGQLVSIEGLGTLIANRAGNNAPWVYGKARAGDVDVRDTDLSALVGGFGIMPETDLVDGIEQTIEWWRKEHGTRTPDGPDAA